MTEPGKTPFGAVQLPHVDLTARRAPAADPPPEHGVQHGEHGEDDDRSVLEILFDSAQNERRQLIPMLYGIAHHRRPCLRSAIRRTVDPGDVPAPQAVTEGVVTLLLAISDTPEEYPRYLKLAERLDRVGLFDTAHFNTLMTLLVLDKGAEQGTLPAEVYDLVERRVSEFHPDWADILDDIEPES